MPSSYILKSCFKQAEEQAVEAKKAMKKFLLGSMTVGKMEEKLKVDIET